MDGTSRPSQAGALKVGQGGLGLTKLGKQPASQLPEPWVGGR